MYQAGLKWCAAALAVSVLGSCGGGGGGGGDAGPTEKHGVFTGVSNSFDFNWDATSGSPGGGDGGVGAGADGDGGVGGGGDFGQFRNALVTVKLKDGTVLGSAKTDATNGMVTIYPGKTYQGPLYLELSGGPDATYYEEGKDTFVPFPAGQVVRAIVPKIDKNIGITVITDAAYRLLTEGSTPAGGIGTATAAQISAANDTVRDIVNQQFPKALEVGDITRLPFIKSSTVGKTLPVNSTSAEGKRGVYGLVSGAFSKQAAMFNAQDPTPTLSALKQLGEDLRDGKLDGMFAGQPAVTADKRTYDPQTVAGELSSALAQQSFRFGDTSAEQALPPVTNFGNVRYEGYLFDASLNNKGEAFTTVAGWVSVNDPGDSLGGPPLGTARPKVTPAPRIFGVFGNFGHGGLFLKTDAADSRSSIYAVGDNVNGELGVGNRDATQGSVVPLTLPGILTHVSGGLSHTVARLADGSVYTWGDNLYGQLGQGVDWNTLQGSTVPLKVTLPAGAVAVAASNTASYALFADGTVYSWGSSWGFGLLGDGNKNGLRTTPGAVMSPTGPLTGVVQIAARDNDVVVLKADGSVWTWGAHPSDNSAYVPGDPTAPYAGGSPMATQIIGIPPGTQIRKIITEQGLFAALATDGRVWTWGVHFDITAGEILRVLTPEMVLGLPPVRDLMPGGFVGYGSRPFDRLTAMAIDYRGNMWKVRGLVAEQFHPETPIEQRRPQHDPAAGALPPCKTCHLILTDWPLTPPDTTGAPVCVPPSAIHESGSISLIHADTKCEQCHNPARTVVRPSFTNGWLNCSRPTNLPARPTPVGPTPPAAGTPECTVPVGHVFTPPGTVCASCHNSIIAVPLQSVVPACITPNPNSTQLPTLQTTAAITGATNGGTAIAAGATVSTTAPTLQGTLSAALLGGQTLRVSRNGTALTPGLATVSGLTWSYTDAGAPNGAVAYTVRVEALPNFGARSNSFGFTVDTVAPTVAANVAGVAEDGGPIANNAFTTDTTPTVTGTLTAALTAGDVVRVLRNGATVGSANVAGGNWTYQEASALALGDYTYTARVVDAAGNLGATGSGWTVRITSLPTVAITQVFDNPGGSVIAQGAVTADSTPRIAGSLNTALTAGQLVRVLRNGASAGTATVSGTAWTFDDSVGAAVSATQTYTARAEAGTLNGVASAGYAIFVDNVAPPAVASVTGIFDDFVGTVPPGGSTTDSTPLVSGTLSTTLNAAGASAETLQVLRNGAVIAATPSISGLTWSLTEPVPMAAGATNVYSARVIDAAGNVSAAGATRSVTYDATTRTASITGAFNGATLIPAGTATSDTTPEIRGSVNTALLAGQWVRVLRDGVAVSGQLTPSGTTWTYTDTIAGSVTQSYSYTARVESASVTGASSPAYAFTVDNIVPAQTFSFTAFSSVTPNSTLSGAVPADSSIAANGSTNDPRPTIRVTLSGALASGESLVFRRVLNGVTTVISPSVISCGTNCFQFRESADVVSIPVPATAPNSALPGSGAAQYRVSVRDAALNETVAPGTFSFTFDYFTCNQVRATNAAANAPSPSVHITISSASNPSANCSSCHTPFTAAGTPAGTFIPVPRTSPTYWCRRP